MGDFKSLAEVAKEMEQQKQKPWRPPTNAAEANAETSRLRRLAREQVEQAVQESTEEEPAVPMAVTTQQPLAKAKPPSFDTAKYLSIAAHCQVSRQHVSAIMSGDRNPSIRVLNKMADYFKMPMDKLYARLEKIKNEPEVWLG